MSQGPTAGVLTYARRGAQSAGLGYYTKVGGPEDGKEVVLLRCPEAVEETPDTGV